MGVLLQYYDSGQELSQHNSTKTARVTSKRQNWLLLKPDKFKFEKTSSSKTKKPQNIDKNVKSTSKEATKRTKRRDNNGNKPDIDKQAATISTALLEEINKNNLINNKPKFLDWFLNTYTIKNSFKTNSITTFDNGYKQNYYYVLNDNNEYDRSASKDNNINKQIREGNIFVPSIETKTKTKTSLINMPLLTPKVYYEPVLERSEEAVETDDNIKEQPEDEWLETNHKEIEREKKATLSIYSPNYLPQNIPPVPQKKNTIISQTHVVLALSIRVTRSKQSRSSFRHSRIVAGVLGAMKLAFEDTYLGTIEQEFNAKIIHHVNDMPLEIGNLKQYLSTPVSSKPGKFLGKIYVHCNHTIQEYCQNHAYSDYLAKENIQVDINELDDINPYKVGFLENLIPRMETLNMHTHRLRSMMPSDAPKFQLQLGPLWGGNGEKTRVVLIQSDEKNRDILKQMLEEMHAAKLVSFFPWTCFMSCKPEQKSTVVKRINTRRANYRSLLISGFRDNDDNIPMKLSNSNDDDKLTKIGVTEFLQTMVKTSGGEKLFHYVYPPYYGTREVIVTLQNFSQALSYTQIAHGELARNMDDEAIEEVFLNPENAKQEAVKKPWVSIDRVVNIVPTVKNTNEYNPKRYRTDKNDNTTQKTRSSYSSITASHNEATKTVQETNQEIETFRNELKSMKASINNNNVITNQTVNELRQDMDKQMVELKDSIEDKIIRNENSITSMKHEVEIKIHGLHIEMRTNNNEMAKINDTLADLGKMMSSMHGQMQKVKMISNEECSPVDNRQDEMDDTDENLMDCKQHGGTRVTRSKSSN
jgi:hypothetical protein